MTGIRIPLIAALMLLATCGSASAHVSLSPGEAPAGGLAVLTVRVPNESTTAATTKGEMKRPAGVISATYDPRPGWSVTVRKAILAKPIETPDGPIDEAVSQVTWTADNRSAQITPGQFADFKLGISVPNSPGKTLSFKTLQSYSDGNIVRWIGPEGSEDPAPLLKVGPAEASASSAHGAAADSSGADATVAKSGSGGSTTATIALVLAALAALIALAALVLARRR